MDYDKLSIEDKREYRKEQLLKKLLANPALLAAGKDIVGKVARYEAGKARFVDWHQAATKPGTNDAEVRREPSPAGLRSEASTARTVNPSWSVPDVVRRTNEQRVEAYAARLKDAPPALQEELLKRVHSEYWKAGMPVTMEDLRVVARHYLQRGERQNKKKR